MNGFSQALNMTVPLDRTRVAFLRKTYAHLMAAIIALVAFEVFLFQSGLAVKITMAMVNTSWLLFLGGFMLVGWLARSAAHRSQSMATQYLALGGYVVANGIILAPLLLIAAMKAPGIIESAVAITLIGFAGLTAIVFVTKRDFSFMGQVLRWAGFCALGLIVASIAFGFSLGILFSVAMIALAGAGILYDTSNVLHHYPENRYVGASLELFASIALLFWYVLRLLTSRD